MLPVEARLFTPVLVILESGLSFHQRAQACIAESLFELLLTLSHVYVNAGPLSCNLIDLLIPLAQQIGVL